MSGILILLNTVITSGVAVYVTTFVLSLVFAYLVGKFSPNLWIVALVVLVLQAAGYLWGLSRGVFFGQSILEIVSVLMVTFIWYMVAAHMHLWLKERSPELAGGK